MMFEAELVSAPRQFNPLGDPEEKIEHGKALNTLGGKTKQKYPMQTTCLYIL